jgi:DNA-binding GntR family transcriptional regulator
MDQRSPEKLTKKGDLNEIVYRRLKELILSGRLRPGNQLHHQELADQLSVSRTPVRESLERLCQEGYAARRPRRGYFVAEVGTADVQDLYETREALELFALRKTCEAGFSPRQLAELGRINAAYTGLFSHETTRERLMVDQRFHVTLAGYSGNVFISRMLTSVFEKINLKRRIDGAGFPLDSDAASDHRNLMAALAAGRHGDAHDVLRQHIRGARLRVLRQLELNRA